MNGIYTVYKREADGTQGDLIAAMTSLEMVLSAKELSKFTIEGVTAGKVPLEDGDGLIIYRNGVMFLGAVVEIAKAECPDPAVNVKYWTVDGREDTSLFSRRQVLADPVDFTFDGEAYDQIEDSAHNRMIHYIDACCGSGTVPERRFAGMRLPGKDDRGTTAVSAYRSEALDKVLSEIGEADELYPKIIRNDKTGAMRVIIQAFRDKTDDIVISPEFGNVVSWSREDTIPEFNAVWVVSGDFSEGRLYVFMEDEESVRKYGRIEAIVSRSDIKVYEPAEGKEEEEETEENPHLSKEDVLSILQEEAKTQLKEHGRKRSYTIEAAETHSMAFMDDWQVGDHVTCVIDGEKFESQITEAKITYKEGIETVQPTVGDVEKGLFGRLFDTIEGLDDRINRVEK